MFDNILILAPHTDDGEIGCGGTIAKFTAQGRNVYYAAFSSARHSLKKGMHKDTLKDEVKEATKVLGIPNENLILFEYRVRTFPLNRQEILENMVQLKKEINPSLIFVPSLNDIHQDHQVIASEGLRAFKHHTILGYEEPWNNIVFETRSFIPLEKSHVQKKIDALKCYHSQAHRSYLNEDFVWSLARARGTQIEGEYAEAFEVLRWVINSDFMRHKVE